MFSLNSKPRSHSQSFSQSDPYRAPDYYLPGAIPSQVSNSSSATPRGFVTDHQNHGRNDLYHDPHLYGGTRKSYDERDVASSSVPYNQSYDRHNEDHSDLQLPPTGPYRPHLDHRPVLPTLPQLKPTEIPNMLHPFGLAPPPHPTFTSEPDSAINDRSRDTEFWTPNSVLPPPPPAADADAEQPKTKKPRREKPHIALAPDQPPTTQGKPRARVYVACLQCRTRKIRCDGAKPVCHNCGRRASGNTECSYDPVPKRRGPDRTPGARQRMARDVQNEIDSLTPSRRRRRTRETSTSEAGPLNRAVSEGSQGKSDAGSIRPISLSPPTAEGHPVCPPSNFSPDSNYSRHYSPECGCHGLVHCPDLLDVSALSESRKTSGAMSTSSYNDAFDLSAMIPQYNASRAYIIDLDENGKERQDSHSPEIGNEPSLDFTRKIWWDSLLSLYLSPGSSYRRSLNASERESASQGISTDLRFIFHASNYWFSFFHIPSFFGNFFDVNRRERMQPSLILSLLAISIFWQSSEVGLGRNGRERALRFRDEAQSAMEASFNAGWIDETLAQAAWLLALFEVCSHPRHSSARSTSSMVMLDSIIRSLSLTMVDADDPNTTLFPPGSVPVVSSPRPQLQQLQQRTAWFPDQPLVRSLSDNNDAVQQPSLPHSHDSDKNGCSCNSMTLVESWPSATEHAPMWAPTPAWDESWSEGEIRKESCRRLCWSSMMLAAGHISYTIAHRSQGLDLFISDPANYALLFSGESVARSPTLSPSYSSKDTIWALHDRAFLLWHGCIRMRNDGHATDTDKAHFAVKAWLEADALESALNKHTCAIERAFIFQAREYIFNTRMCISYEFQRYIPLVTANVNGLFHRKKAEEWLTHQATVAQRFMLGLHTITGNLHNLLARRPFFVFWFMGQIHRALSLWQCDNTLTVALDVCKALLPAIDYLTALWPCPEQRYRYETLRKRLDGACFAAGTSPPPPPNLSPPAPSSPEALV